MPGRCQICGRRKHELRKGGLAMHHVNGDRCAGTGHPPIERGHDALAARIDALQAEARAHRAIIKEKLDQRANYIDPRHEAIARDRELQADKLARRLRRHLSWPARFERQMERHGWGNPPPAYLVSE